MGFSEVAPFLAYYGFGGVNEDHESIFSKETKNITFRLNQLFSGPVFSNLDIFIDVFIRKQ